MFLVLYTLSFFGFGLLIGIFLIQKKFLPKEFLYIGSVAISLLFSYLLFFIYLLSPWFARNMVLGFIAVGIFFVIRIYVAIKKNETLRKTIISYFFIPLALTALIFATYSALFYSCQNQPTRYGGYGEVRNDTFCTIKHLPFDNALSYIYGNNILNNNDKKKALSWYLVDRPPLQIAATLPVLGFTKDTSRYRQFTSYHLFSVILQLSWVGAVWGICKKLKLRSIYIVVVIIGLSVTGFFFINSVFVWPKLLAASLVAFATLLLIDRSRLKQREKYLPMAAIAASLGILSHSGVMFTLLPLFIYVVIRFMREKRWYKKLKYPALAAMIVLVTFIPWQLYKSSVNKNDRLLEWHLAGISKGTDSRPTTKTIVEEYRKLDFAEWVEARQDNLHILVVGSPADYENCVSGLGVLRGTCSAQEWRGVTFFSTFFAFEFFIVGFFLIFYRLARGKLDTTDKTLFGLTLASVLVWSVMMFLPGGAIVHQGSYATMLLGFILFAKIIIDLQPKLLIGLVASQSVLFCLIWIVWR